MNSFARRLSAAAFAAAGAALWFSMPAVAAESSSVARGKYLVDIAGCLDCHTPGNFLGKRDKSRLLAGSEVGFEIPGMGVFYGSNLTPDVETGLGNWTAEQIATALRSGVRPDGRQLAPVMPWQDFAKLTKADALAIAAYLKTLKPVSNRVPGPFGPDEQPTSFVMKVVPPPAAR